MSHKDKFFTPKSNVFILFLLILSIVGAHCRPLPANPENGTSSNGNRHALLFNKILQEKF